MMLDPYMNGLTLKMFFSCQNDFSDDFVFLPALPNCSEWELHPALCVPILSFYLQHALASCCSILDDTFFMRISSQRIEFSFLLFFLFLRILSGSRDMPSFFFPSWSFFGFSENTKPASIASYVPCFFRVSFCHL